MELPDWAHFCERCGARVGAAARHGDPLDQVEMGEAPAEPLWEDEAVASEDEAVEAELRDASPGPSGDQTQLMDAAEMAEAAGDLTVAMPAPETDEPAEGQDIPDADASEDVAADVLAADAEAIDEAEDADVPQEEPPLPELTEALDMDRELADIEDEGETVDEEAAPARPETLPPLAQEWIDVGEDDGSFGDESYETPYLNNPWEGRSRPSERLGQRKRGSVPMVVGAFIAAGAIVIGLLVARLVIGGGDAAQQDDQVSLSTPVASGEATRIIEGLAGWWKTDRTFDGRYWHIENGVMEVYAADGVLASQATIDPASMERLAEGPGGIEGPGYYLRDIAFFLRDGEDDTLYAVDSDGSADEAANLHRVDPPGYMADGAVVPESDEPATEASDDYVLPDSSERAYETWELEGLSDYDLFVARNEIYARHGYVFEGQLSEYFAGKSWYTPSDMFNEGDISEVERENVGTILAIEQARGSQYL